MAEPLRIVRRPSLTLWQAALWPDAASAGAAALAQTAGAPLPPPGRAATGAGGTLAPVGPLRWWLIDGAGPALDPAHGVTLDLSAEQVCLEIAGAPARDLLTRIVSIDLRDATFPVGGFAATGGHRMILKLWRAGAQDWRLFAMRSYADHLTDLLTHHARQFAVRHDA